MPIVPASNDTDVAPVLIFQGGSDELQLEPGGRVYKPGDVLPKDLSQVRKNALRAAGILLTTRHAEPVLTPEGSSATIAAAEQIEGPAVIAAVEPAPSDAPKDEPSPRATRRGEG
jgi:hypothetical protein